MAQIRTARKSDLKSVEYICRMTAGPKSKAEPIIGNMVAKTYSTYYIREAIDTCFVLADENDNAVGYILCEPDFKRYKKLYRKFDVPFLFEIDKLHALQAWFFPVPYCAFGKKYPAHLHIDILPEYQAKGYGSKMVEALLSELKKRNIPGVMLLADIENTGAVRFYERLGFETILSSKAIGCVALGKKI